MGKRIAIIVTAVLVVLIAAGAWAAWTFREAEQHLQSARVDLEQARTDLATYDVTAAQQSIASAKVQSADAAQLTNRWVWRAAAAVPKLGDSADAARALVLAADSTVTALSGITDSLVGVDLENVVKDKTVDLQAVAAAGDAARSSADPLAQARAYLADSPRPVSGGWVLPVIEDARAELSVNVTALTDTAETMQKVGELLPTALGSQEAKTYFVAVQAPNETRGTGGLLGTWAVVRAEQGKITVIDSGANEDLPDLNRMPGGFGPGYAYRYGDDPTLVPNMNMSPDYPVAAQLWLDSYRKKTGRQLDGALSLDVTALGQLLSATGTTIPLPDGGSLNGAEFPDFVLRGIYDKFPDFSDNRARRAYQAAVGTAATERLLALRNPQDVLGAMAELLDQRRIALWVADPVLETELLDSLLGHSLQPAKPNSVEPVLINIGWSKLDTFIERTFDYQVGRCPAVDGRVRSELTMTFESAIPPGTVLPPYVVGTVPKGAAGPINQVYLQTYLPPDSEVVDVLVDGKSTQWQPFEEAGRPFVGLTLALPARQAKAVKVVFNEPGSGATGQVLVQPMAKDATVTIGERPC